jgi:hypothetical protein
MGANDGFTSFSGLSIPSGGTVHVHGASTVSLGATGGLSINSATLLLSVKTYATAAGIADGAVGVVMQASGLSIIYRSGATYYTLGASATSAAVS